MISKLLPISLFLVLFLSSGIINGDFYQLQSCVAIIPALALAVILFDGTTDKGIDTLIEGICDPNIIYMVMIYNSAGIFNAIMIRIGGIHAVVASTVAVSNHAHLFLLPGVFVASSIVSLAIGTSMGTISAVTPIALALAKKINLPVNIFVGAVLSGAACGDNLSVISDTAIAACRSQNADFFQKLRINFKIAFIPMLLTFGILTWQSSGFHFQKVTSESIETVSMWSTLPYILLIGLALLKLNVLACLFIGCVVAFIIGLCTTPDPRSFFSEFPMLAYEGMRGELDIVLTALFMGGLSKIFEVGGGLDRMATFLSSFSSHGVSVDKVRLRGELIIGVLVVFADILCANNTVAIILVGRLARKVATLCNVNANRAATILDVWSCGTQGLLPHGAQLLLACRIGGDLSPFSVMKYALYPVFLLGSVLIFSTFDIGHSGKKSK